MNKKIIAFGFACLFAVSMAAPVGAITDAEYQTLVDQLADLTALYNTLLAQTSVPTTVTGLCLTSYLSLGTTSDEVQNLQQGLNQDPATQVAVSGAGSPGFETSYFGPLTKAAVIKFQNKYASEVLASWGITQGTGYAGQTTIAKFNALYCTPVVPAVTYPAGCTSAVGFSTTTGLSCSGAVTYPAGCTSAVGYSTTTGLSCSGVVSYPAGCTSAVGYSSTTGLSCATGVPSVATEGTLTVTQYAIPGSGTITVYGGNVQKEVAAYKIKATNSDIRIKRALVQFDLSTDFPWRALSSISLWDGSTMLKEILVNQTNCTEITFSTTYQMTIDGLDVLVAKDTEKVLSLKVTAVSVPQYEDTIYVSLPANGVRGVDSAALNVYGPASAIASTSHYFTTSVGQIPTITTTAAIDSPLAGNFIGSASTITRVDLMKINVKVEGVDMIFKGGSIQIDTNASSTLSAIELYDGTTLLASVAATSTADTEVTLSTYTLPVSAGTTKVLTVKGVVKADPDVGDVVAISLTTAIGLTGIDSNGAARNNTGAITGNSLTVYTAAPIFALASASVAKSDSSTTTTNNVGDFTIGVSVTANSGDLYLPTVDHATYGSLTTLVGGFYPAVSTSTANAAATATSSTWTCDASAVEDTSDDVWRIPSGATSVCTYNYHVLNTTAASYYTVSIYSITWGTSIAEVNLGTYVQTTGLSALKAPSTLLNL